jgi:hypothetical protein
MQKECNHPTCENGCRRETKQKKVYKIKPVSDKRKVDEMVYRLLRKVFLNKKTLCEIKAPGCTCVATVVHHTRGRVLYYLTVSTWMASCSHCNLYIEQNDKWARGLGYLKSKFEVI